MKRAGIILCGGRSQRMGTPKHALKFGPETMLERIVRLLGECCTPLVVVAAAGQELPALPDDVRIVHDQRPERGPLEGLHAGLTALPADVEAAYVTGCDVPLLVAGFRAADVRAARRAFDCRAGERGFLHPLAAVYRPSVADVIAELLARDQLRPTHLFDIVSTRRVDERELLDVDPRLNTLRNLNEPADYQAALALAGFAAQ